MSPPARLLLWVLLLAAAEAIEFPEDMQEIIAHIHNTCVAITGVDENDIKNCLTGTFKDDKKLKCYMFCLMEEASFVDEDGTMDYDMLISMIPEPWTEQLGAVINACRHHGLRLTCNYK